MKKIIYSTLLAITLLILGCVKEKNEFHEGSEARVTLKLETRSDLGPNNEDEIKSIHILSAFPEGSSNAGMVEVNGGKRDDISTDGSITQRLLSGVRDLYIITNETDGLETSLEGRFNLDHLKRLEVPYDDVIKPPFVGYTVLKNMDIKEGGDIDITAKVQRIVAKVVLTLNYSRVESPEIFSEFEFKKVTIRNVPLFSYLIPSDYDYNRFMDVVNTGGLKDESEDPNVYKTTLPIMYIPEFLGGDRETHTYIEIRGTSRNNLSGDITRVYRIPLSSTMAKDGTIIDNNYNINRNDAFLINATLVSDGQDYNLDVGASVVDWNEVTTPQEVVGQYMKVNSITTSLSSADLLLDSSYVYHHYGETIYVNYSTNMRGIKVGLKVGDYLILEQELDPRATRITLILPRNYGIAGQNVHLYFYNSLKYSSIKIYDSKSEPHVRLNVDRTQGAVVRSTMNHGATKVYEVDSIHRSTRNLAFSSPSEGVTITKSFHGVVKEDYDMLETLFMERKSHGSGVATSFSGSATPNRLPWSSTLTKMTEKHGDAFFISN